MNGVQSINPDILLESACGDRIAAVELLDLFFDLAGEEMQHLCRAAAAGHAAVVSALAHKLVGSSLACGLAGFADDLHALEHECRKNGMPSDIDARIRSLAMQLSEARTFFEASWKIV